MMICGNNMGNDLLVIPCDLAKGHDGPCERNFWPVVTPVIVAQHAEIASGRFERMLKHLPPLGALRNEIAHACRIRASDLDWLEGCFQAHFEQAFYAGEASGMEIATKAEKSRASTRRVLKRD